MQTVHSGLGYVALLFIAWQGFSFGKLGLQFNTLYPGMALGLTYLGVSLYEAFAAGRPSPLPDLPVQFADYAVWQRAWLQVARCSRISAAGTLGPTGRARRARSGRAR